MIVAQLMSRHVKTVTMDDSVRTVHRLFQVNRFHHLLVVSRSRVVGVISDRDLLKNLSPFVGKLTERTQDLALFRRRVHQIMSRSLVTARAHTDVFAAVALMVKRGLSCFPVVSAKGEPMGIITSRDILKWVSRSGPGAGLRNTPSPAEQLLCAP